MKEARGHDSMAFHLISLVPEYSHSHSYKVNFNPGPAGDLHLPACDCHAFVT